MGTVAGVSIVSTEGMVSRVYVLSAASTVIIVGVVCIVSVGCGCRVFIGVRDPSSNCHYAIAYWYLPGYGGLKSASVGSSKWFEVL